MVKNSDYMLLRICSGNIKALKYLGVFVDRSFDNDSENVISTDLKHNHDDDFTQVFKCNNILKKTKINKYQLAYCTTSEVHEHNF